MIKQNHLFNVSKNPISFQTKSIIFTSFHYSSAIPWWSSLTSWRRREKPEKMCGFPVSFAKQKEGFWPRFHSYFRSQQQWKYTRCGREERRWQQKKRNLVLFKTHTRLPTIRSMHIKKKSLSFLETARAKNLTALPSKRENPCDTKQQPLTPKQSYLSKHDLHQSISYHMPWFYVERKCRKASICQPLNSTLAWKGGKIAMPL